MATITPSPSGGAITYVAASGGGDQFFNGGSERLHVKNGGGSPITVTINSQKPCDQGSDHDVPYTVGAGADKLLPGLSPVRFNDGSNYVQVAYSGVGSVTVAVITG